MKVLIDNGHGINTPGKQSPDGRLREYEYARLIASRLEKAFERTGKGDKGDGAMEAGNNPRAEVCYPFAPGFLLFSMALRMSLPTLCQSEAKASLSERSFVGDVSRMLPKMFARDAIPKRKDFIAKDCMVSGANIGKTAVRVRAGCVKT